MLQLDSITKSSLKSKGFQIKCNRMIHLVLNIDEGETRRVTVLIPAGWKYLDGYLKNRGRWINKRDIYAVKTKILTALLKAVWAKMAPCGSANTEGPQVCSAYTGLEKFKTLEGKAELTMRKLTSNLLGQWLGQFIKLKIDQRLCPLAWSLNSGWTARAFLFVCSFLPTRVVKWSGNKKERKMSKTPWYGHSNELRYQNPLVKNWLRL